MSSPAIVANSPPCLQTAEPPQVRRTLQDKPLVLQSATPENQRDNHSQLVLRTQCCTHQRIRATISCLLIALLRPFPLQQYREKVRIGLLNVLYHDQARSDSCITDPPLRQSSVAMRKCNAALGNRISRMDENRDQAVDTAKEMLR